MKISLAWVFDHIVGSVDAVNIADLIARFNESVAEIESYHSWNFDPQTLILAQVVENGPTFTTVRIGRTTIQLSQRTDLTPGDAVFVTQHAKNRYQWARMTDCGSSKDALLPAVDPASVDMPVSCTDTILEIDNKSITNRPDLWSHRGIAREIAALYGLTLTDQAQLYADIPVVRTIEGTAAHAQAPTLKVQAPTACRRLSATFVDVAWHPSRFDIMLRLCRIDSRPIDALVDLTNYVMFDCGQPMHAFDANHIAQHTLIARYAQVGEQVTLLDGSRLELHPQDLVIADSAKPLSLAGIMGGQASAVSRTTQQLLIEAGNFEPTTIRLTAARYTKRTEASMRFEKNMDPEMATYGLKRYCTLLKQHQLITQLPSVISDWGPAVAPTIIKIAHTTIEQKLGMSLSTEKVIQILTTLYFKIDTHQTNADDVVYIITVPTLRAVKDVRIPEDIVEEVGRFVGYRTIPAHLPYTQHAPAVACATYRMRQLKRYCADVLRMHELSSYPFFDESWLLHLRWQPADTVEAINPVSGNWRRLVTSLIPALLKGVHEQAEGIHDIRYFEIARTWLNRSPVLEQKQLAGVIYTRDTKTDFYTIKQYIDELCTQIGLPLTWRPLTHELAPWYDPYCVAQCLHQERVIGTVGLLNQAWKERIVQTGLVAIFELDATALLEEQRAATHYVRLPKYPDIVRDVSVLMPTSLKAAEIIAQIKKIDPRIHTVDLVDFFKKPDWKERISLSMRYTIRDDTKTLTSEEASTITHHIETLLTSLGGEIR